MLAGALARASETEPDVPLRGCVVNSALALVEAGAQADASRQTEEALKKLGESPG